MKTKLKAAEIVTSSGIPMLIVNSHREGVLDDILDGRKAGTLFKAMEKMPSRKRWIAYGASAKARPENSPLPHYVLCKQHGVGPQPTIMTSYVSPTGAGILLWRFIPFPRLCRERCGPPARRARRPSFFMNGKMYWVTPEVLLFLDEQLARLRSDNPTLARHQSSL